MGLYDDRLADLSEQRRPRRHAERRPARSPAPPPPRRPKVPPPVGRAAARSASEARRSMEIQSLLFSRDSGWTVSKAKAWAKSHDYRYGKTDVTDQYIRIRQFDPKGLKVKRTITLGRGIRAVVAREESMAKSAKEDRRPRRKKAPAKRSTRKARKTRATSARRRKKTTVMAAPKRRRKKAAAKRKRPTRRRTTRARAWYGDTAGHRKAAKKGILRKKRRSAKRRTRETVMEAAPRRRRRRRTTRAAAPRRRRTYARAPRSNGMGLGEFATAMVSAGVGFVVADGVDRLLATYNPASTEERPKDKFTSDGAGTLANTLNVASAPGVMRLAAAAGLVAVPAVASRYVKGSYVKSSLQGLAAGMFANGFKLLWNNVVIPMLKPKDTSAASLQKSYIARLYPAEIAASINREQEQTAVSSAGGAGALSGADVGPFALSAESPYPSAAESLRDQTGMRGTPGNDYPTTQNVWGTGGESDYPTATQAMVDETGRVGAPAASGNPGQPGVSQPTAYEPGPPPLPGPGPKAKPHDEDPDCGCMADGDQFLGFIGDQPTEEPLYASAAE